MDRNTNKWILSLRDGNRLKDSKIIKVNPPSPKEKELIFKSDEDF